MAVSEEGSVQEEQARLLLSRLLSWRITSEDGGAPPPEAASAPLTFRDILSF
jgi:hypothetical protein